MRSVAAPVTLILLSGCSDRLPVETSSTCVGAKLPASLALVDKMIFEGLDVRRPRLVSHLFLGSPQNLNTLQLALSKLGYQIRVAAQDGSLLAFTQAGVTSQWAKATIPQMCNAAEKASVTYDGWDVDVAADHIKG